MDLVQWVIVFLGIGIGALFNYWLNRAPGSDPDDFKLGPNELDITCDCFLNPIILAGLGALFIALSANFFPDRVEMYFVGALAFIIIFLAGLFGRRQRHREWREMKDLFERAVPSSKKKYPSVDRVVDLFFDTDDEDED